MIWLRRALAVSTLAVGLFLVTPAAPAAAAGACGSVRYAAATGNSSRNSEPATHYCPNAKWIALGMGLGVPFLLTGWSCACGFASGRFPIFTEPKGEWIVVRPQKPQPSPRPQPPPRTGSPRKGPGYRPDGERAESLGRADDVVKGGKSQTEAMVGVGTGTPWHAPTGGTGPVQDPVTAAMIAALFAAQAGQRISQVVMRTPRIVEIIRTVPWPLLP